MAVETYREQLARLAAGMLAGGREAEIAASLESGSSPAALQMFVSGNLEKRWDKLTQQLEFVAQAFDDLDELIAEYVKSRPQATVSSVAEDADELLAWLCETKELSGEQRDFIACQRARHAVEAAARGHRAASIRFQELLSVAPALAEELDGNAGLRLYLNPARAWTTFESAALLDEDAETPSDVLFFARGEEISTAVLELEGQALVNELADFQPCSLDEWAALTRLSDRAELLEFARDLIEMGLVAAG